MRITAVALLLAFAPAAMAQAPNCRQPQTQMEANLCAAEAYKRTDAEMTAIYRQIRARLKDDEATTQLLIKAQRAWIAFRDGECVFSSSRVEGGSAHGMVLTLCRDAMTKKRIAELKVYLSCEDGDMSCPVPAR